MIFNLSYSFARKIIVIDDNTTIYVMSYLFIYFFVSFLLTVLKVENMKNEIKTKKKTSNTEKIKLKLFIYCTAI